MQPSAKAIPAGRGGGHPAVADRGGADEAIRLSGCRHGQRTTASGSARYDNARTESGDVFPAAERFSYQPHFYQIAMLSVLTGITRAALRDGSAALTARKRNYPQGLTEAPTQDAQLLQVSARYRLRGSPLTPRSRRAAARWTTSSPDASPATRSSHGDA